MTFTSLEELGKFLINSQGAFWDDMRIADYGGTENIGDNKIAKLLAEGDLNNYHMLDFDNGVDLREPIQGEKFDLGICMDLLEHTSNPFLVARNIIDSLNKDALLLVTCPFVWELHAYPNDFWRFTPNGLQELFKDKTMEVITVYTINDLHKPPQEELSIPNVSFPWIRVVGIFKKVSNV